MQLKKKKQQNGAAVVWIGRFMFKGVILFLFIPQDLKPGNLAINPDCELKVG